jgi:hypothetical protein
MYRKREVLRALMFGAAFSEICAWAWTLAGVRLGMAVLATIALAMIAGTLVYWGAIAPLRIRAGNTPWGLALNVFVVIIWMTAWYPLVAALRLTHGLFYSQVLSSFLATMTGQLIFRFGERRRPVSDPRPGAS